MTSLHNSDDLACCCDEPNQVDLFCSECDGWWIRTCYSCGYDILEPESGNFKLCDCPPFEGELDFMSLPPG